jgi:hypothetical protein
MVLRSTCSIWNSYWNDFVMMWMMQRDRTYHQTIQHSVAWLVVHLFYICLDACVERRVTWGFEVWYVRELKKQLNKMLDAHTCTCSTTSTHSKGTKQNQNRSLIDIPFRAMIAPANTLLIISV